MFFTVTRFYHPGNFEAYSAHKQRMYYTFNLTKIPSSDKLLRAELHLFKLKPKIKTDARRQHYFQVHLFKLTNDDPTSTEDAELIGMRLISTQRTGWEVFTITEAVESWIANSTMNLGLLLTVTNLNGEIMEESGIRFAQRGKHHDSKQPNLVIFSDDGRPKPAGLPLPKEAGVDSGYDYIIETYDNTNTGEHVADSSETHNTDTTEEFKHVMKRHVMTESNSTTKSNDDSESGNPARENHKGKTRRSQRSGPCSLQPMYVDFNVIGWSDWIISPEGYNANRCDGKCAFPLTSLVNPSNHASVQSLINTLNLGSNVGEPCCVPNETEHITLLYYTDDDNVVLKHFDGMIAKSCGCQ
ncbi:bone morphogenetic protein 2-B-like [Anneissia japonica]|uniref:bone morphogenetic protein 2-B-like n=1 Tax=Anneissia japonica TaxID=1529436 RepID=UPI0014255646|nr:bone morphogenetic protein 2-B-like [Anneissia japonica]